MREVLRATVLLIFEELRKFLWRVGGARSSHGG
jgi:hypothetical protein